MQHIRAAVETLKADKALNETTELRQKKYLNNTNREINEVLA